MDYPERKVRHQRDEPPTEHFVPQVEAGQVLAVHYRLIERLGRGGMGVVWLAEDTKLRVRRAVKFVPPEMGFDLKAQRRLEEEALRVARLRHPHIVQIHALEDEESLRFIVMDYIPGWKQGKETFSHLGEWIPIGGHLSEDQVRALLPGILDALHYAHTFRDEEIPRGLIHRDIKPSNILFDQAGRPMVADFGIAENVQSSMSRLTGTGPTSGTLPYMSPEALLGNPSTPASDIYSLGIMIYEMLTGDPPFITGDITYQHIHKPVPRIEGVSHGMNALIQKAVAKKPEDRFSSCAEMKAALEEKTEMVQSAVVRKPEVHRQFGEEVRAGVKESVGLVRKAVLAEETKPKPPKQSQRGLFVAAVIGVCVLLGAMGWWQGWFGQNGGHTTASSTASTPSTPGTERKTMTVDLGGGAKMELVWIPAGGFQMGSPDTELGRGSDEGPVHTVELDGFWIGKCHVTQEQYEAVMGQNPSFFKGDKNPVECVSWNDATEFCRKLVDRADRVAASSLEASSSTLPGWYGPSFRLPTEAEWEYACRAGSTTRFCFGEKDARLRDYAWYDDNLGGSTHPVGTKKPNDWGLYDMHGNVWGWCADRYGERYYAVSPRRNPQGSSSGERRVLRGGSWAASPQYCRSANRIPEVPTGACNMYGFRVVCAGEVFHEEGKLSAAGNAVSVSPGTGAKSGILSVPDSDIVEVSIDHGSMESLRLVLRQGKLHLDRLDEEMEERPSEVSAVSGALSWQNVENVFAADCEAVKALEFKTTYTAKAKTGTVYTAKIAEKGGKKYVSLSAVYDERLFTDTDKATVAGLAAAQKGAEEAKAAVPEFNKKHGPWVYELPEQTFRNLTKKRNDLMRPIPMPKEVPMK